MNLRRCITAALLLLLPLALAAESGRQRLILKDGSYQVVTKYEIRAGDVHYFSAEREVWEDIPSNLIDWDATAKWNKQHHRDNATDDTPATADNSTQVASSGDGGLSEAAKLDAEAAAERADLRSLTPRVAPGLHLPDQDGVFVLDNFQDIPELVHLDQTSGNVNRDPGHNVLRAAMNSFHGAQEPVRIAGQAAKVRVHVDDPVLYVSLDTPEQEAPEAAWSSIPTAPAPFRIKTNTARPTAATPSSVSTSVPANASSAPSASAASASPPSPKTSSPPTPKSSPASTG